MTEREFLLQVSALRDELNGQAVISYGGVWTAEAREPSRKQQMHRQLRLARQLRALLEAAAEKAEQAKTRAERLEILQEQSVHVNTLVSLTEAVRGGYTLKEYDEYSRFFQEFQARNRGNENEEATASHLTTTTEEQNAAPSVKRSGARRMKLPIATRRKPTVTAKRPATYLSASSSDEEAPRKRSAFPSSNPSTADHDEDCLQTSTKSKQAKSSDGRIQRRNVLSRRCHDCKSSTFYFRRCHYWHLNGTKCNKIFCSRCLIDKYGCTDEEGDGWEANNPDWQ